MAYKIHLQANKAENSRAPFAICAARPAGNGKCRSNSRVSYQTIPQSHIVGAREFRAAHAADHSSVCAHCCTAGLARLNGRRRAEGLPLETTYFYEGAPA